MKTFSQKIVFGLVLTLGLSATQTVVAKDSDEIVVVKVNNRSKEKINSFVSGEDLTRILSEKELNFTNGSLWAKDDSAGDSGDGYIVFTDDSRHAKIDLKNGTVVVGGKSFSVFRSNDFDELTDSEKQTQLDQRMAELNEEMSEMPEEIKSTMLDAFTNGVNINYNLSGCKSSVIKDDEYTDIRKVMVEKLFLVCDKIEVKYTNSRGEGLLQLMKSSDESESKDKIVMSLHGINYDATQDENLMSIAGRTGIKLELYTSLKEEVEKQLHKRKLLKKDYGYDSEIQIKGTSLLP